MSHTTPAGIRFIDLFAGIGGFHYGIERAFYIKQTKRIQQGIKDKNGSDTRESFLGEKPLCVYSNEWDKYANSVYRKHFGECDNRDIRTVEATEIPDHDLLCGGFPCQSFSVAGKRGGFNDTRGTLFFEIARILKQKQPRLCLLENVKGLLSHDQGRTFSTIITTLDELGYDTQWQVLNSKDFGVPQNRERIFIVGHLRGTGRPKVFPIGEDDKLVTQKDNKQLSETKISGTIDSTYQKMHGDGIYVRQPLKFLQRNQKNIEGDYAFTVDGANTGGVRQDMKIRRLTPVECERLQGFPDNWTQYGADGELISDTQRYKMCGNAVTTNVITAIARRLL